MVIGISQSGALPDVVSAVAEGARQGALTAAITNDPSSPLAAAATHVVDLGAGEERSVAATKTYTASLAAIAALAAEGDPQLSGEVARLPHALAAQLWASTIHEGRILAPLVEDPRLVTEEQMESWARDFDSWDVCDGCCSSLFDKTPFAYQKAVEWSEREEEFVKRAAFALMAALAVHDKKADDEQFLEFLPIIKRASDDNRNFVKKAVNMALRAIGKRRPALNVAKCQLCGT